MEKVYSTLTQSASMGDTFYFFEPNNTKPDSKHAHIYLNIYNLLGIQTAAQQGQINPSLAEIYKNKKFLEKKKYSSQPIDHIIRHGIATLLLLEGKSWLYGGSFGKNYYNNYRKNATDYAIAKAKLTCLELYDGDGSTYLKKLEHLDVEQDIERLYKTICNNSTPLLANGISLENNQVVSSLKFLEDNGYN